MAVYYFRNAGVNWGDAANWSLTDGGGATGAVPTAADDALFTANSGNCTINASNRVCKTLDFTGYTNTITMTFGITVSGSVTLVAAMTIAGASGLTINATGTFTSNGKTWPNALTFSATNTLTLADDLSVGGLLTTSGGTTTVNGTFNINASGGITISANLIQGTGTTTLNLTGGTWSGAGVVRINTNLNGNIIVSGIVWFDTRTLTYLSGTITTSGSTLRALSNVTYNTAGVVWNNITFDNLTYTLLSDLNISGNIFTLGTTTFNGTFNINSSGTFNIGNTIQQGTGVTTLNLLGGTWSTTSAGGILRLNTNINGNITISGNVYYNTGTLTYTSGTVNTSGSTLLIQAPTTFNTNIMLWNNISYSSTASTTLLSDLNIGGLYTTFGTFNGTFNINCYGGIRPNGNLAQGTGTTTLNLIGGTWSSAANYIQINTNINGNITISGTVYFMTATLTYLSGKPNVLSGSILSITTCTLINIDKINWRTVQINAGATITMNKFFSGSALIPTRIQSSTTTNYNITFQDGFEKITKFTKISNCTVTNRGQLLCITDKSNKGGNVGVRYINQMPNRIPLNNPSTTNPIGYSTSTYLLADPNTILN